MTKEEMEKQIHAFAELMYKTGYEDGKNAKKAILASVLEENYNKGLNDAWEVARKLVHPVNGGYTDAEKKIIFDNLTSDSILLNYTPSEAIAKIQEYEEIKEYEDKHKCKECKWDEFRDAQHPVGTPCDSCFEGKNFSPKVARYCSILDDICPYDIKCEECEVHCSVERAKQKLKGDKK